MSESTSPVRALRYNLLSAFEKANESFQARLQAAIEQGRISPEIELDERPGIPVAPKISRESRDSAPAIRLRVTYREILWAFIYAWMVLYEESTATQLTTHLPLHHRLEHMLRGVKVSSAENQVDAVPALILRRCARKKGLANFVDWCNMTKRLSSRLFGASSPGAQV